jgi:hypothetical protein
LTFAFSIGLGAFASCSSQHTGGAGPQVSMKFDRAGFFDAPFPSDDLLRDDGSVAIDAFPNPQAIALVDQAKQLVAHDARGFSQNGAVFFRLTGAIDPAGLPDLATSVTPSASVFLIGVTAAAPDYLRRYPVRVAFDPDGGPFGAPNLLSALPLQGVPLRAKTTYAAVVTRAAGLSPSPEMAAIAARSRPDAMPQRAFDEAQTALGALAQAGVAPADVAGIAVFTTDDPTVQLGAVTQDMLARPLPALRAPPQRTDLFDDYCVYASTLPMPDYQQGAPPYDFGSSGGAWTFDPSGHPVVQRQEDARVVVTVPRAPMPAAGYPLMIFVRTGGGGDRPLVDRGPQAMTGGPAIAPGTGPAQWFAKAGVAGAQVDGPHGGKRNLTGADEQFVMFNVFNGPALRDNVRESAAELVLFAHVLEGMEIDVSDCPGATSPARFDVQHMGLMGHSMGATIAPLVLAAEPMLGAAVLSGAGASWIENVVWKQEPVEVRPAFELLLKYVPLERTLTENDPVLTLFQWAEEPADPLVYGRGLVSEPLPGQRPRHVLMEQGIVDHYIMPPIANATSLSLGLDLAGAPLDAANAELTADGAPALEGLLAFSGRAQITLPASGNVASRATAIVVQHPSDGVEDGHEVVFQTDPPKREYRCFLQSWASGALPRVPGPGDVNAPCP